MNLLRRTVRGLEAGSLAGVGVAVLFLATDVIHLAPLRTVAELARPLWGETVDSAATGFSLAAVAAAGAGVVLYSVIHLAAFALLGVVAAWVVPTASFWATLARGAVFGAIACSGVFFAGRYLIASPFDFEVVGPMGLLLANAMAGVIMAAVLVAPTR